MSARMKSAGDHKDTEGSISAMKEHHMSVGAVQGGTAEAADSTRKKGGRKRARAREVAAFIRREIPQAFARIGDLERVSEEYGVAKTEVLAEAVLFLLRRPMGTAPAVAHGLRRVS